MLWLVLRKGTNRESEFPEFVKTPKGARSLSLTALKNWREEHNAREILENNLQWHWYIAEIRNNIENSRKLKISGNIRVFFRIRPMLEAVGEQAIKMDEMDDWAIDVLQPGGKKTSHGADRVLTTTLTQKEVFFRSLIKADIFLLDLRRSLSSNNELHWRLQCVHFCVWCYGMWEDLHDGRPYRRPWNKSTVQVFSIRKFQLNAWFQSDNSIIPSSERETGRYEVLDTVIDGRDLQRENTVTFSIVIPN